MNISIITICRNAGDALSCTAASVLAQSNPPFEYIIQDGNSSDGSLVALSNWLEGSQSAMRLRKADEAGAECFGAAELAYEAGASRIVVRTEPDLGIYDALNRAIARTSGDVIGLLHAGDLYAHTDVLAKVMQAFEDGAEAVYGDLQYVRAAPDGGLRVVRHWRSGDYRPGRLRWGWMPPHPTLFLRRAVYERAARSKGVYFDPAFRCAGDYDFILRALPLLHVAPVYLREVLVQMQTGGISNRNVHNVMLKSLEDWQAIRRNHAGWLHTLVAKNVRKVGQLRVTV